MDDGDGSGIAGQEFRFFHSGVAAADDRNVLFAEEKAVAGGAVGDAAAGEFLFTRDIQRQMVGSCGDDDAFAFVGGDTGFDHQRLRAEIHAFHHIGDDLRAEFFRLFAEFIHQFRPADGVHKSRIVFNIRGQGGLSAEGRSADDHRGQPRPSGVNRRAQSRGTRADDENFTILNFFVAHLETSFMSRSCLFNAKRPGSAHRRQTEQM